jgi:Na+/H+-dicarboxylate symporter
MEQAMVIFWILVAFLLGVIVGIVIHAIASDKKYASALDDMYEIGYAKGKEEGEGAKERAI